MNLLTNSAGSFTYIYQKGVHHILILFVYNDRLLVSIQKVDVVSFVKNYSI